MSSGGLGIYLFHTHHQIAVTKNFLGFVRSKNYDSAYEAWGCTSAKPCPEYTYDKFLEDWGPKSAAGANPVLHITDSERCGTGVILTVDVSPGNVAETLRRRKTAIRSVSRPADVSGEIRVGNHGASHVRTHARLFSSNTLRER